MNRVANLIIKIVIGVIVITFLVEALSPGGALGNLTGNLIAKYPFHQSILTVLGSSFGWDTGFVPAVKSSLLDDILILAIAAVISGGIARVLKNIFNPVDLREDEAKEYVQSERYKLKGIAVSILSSIVTILFSNMVFASVIQKVNGSFIGGIVFNIVKVAVLAVVMGIFIVFIRSAVAAGYGKKIGPEFLAIFLAIGTIIRTIVVDIISVYALAAIVNNASAVAGPLFIIYAVLVIGSFVGGSLRV